MHFVKQRQFAEWCSVKPPAISDLLKRGILHAVERKIDIDDPANLSYLSRHNPELASRIANGDPIDGVLPSAIPGAGRGPAPSRKEPAQKPPKKPRIDPVAMEARRDEARKDGDGWSPPPNSPGGVDGLSPQEMAEVMRKQLYDAQKAKSDAALKALDLDRKNGAVIETALVLDIMEGLATAIQKGFIDSIPKQALLICSRLGAVGRESEIEDILSDDISRAIEDIKGIVIKNARAKWGVRNSRVTKDDAETDE